MVDIFLSYAREDLAKAKMLAAALEKHGWSVFWDRAGLLAGQDFDEVIESEIEQAGCMIVAWSQASRISHWVRGEAQIGQEQKKLVPILFDDVKPPIAFRAIHTEDFSVWDGDLTADAFTKLQRAVSRLVSVAKPAQKQASSKTESPASEPTQAPTKIVTPKNNLEPVMIVIPAGLFYMGSDTGRDNEKPLHKVKLKSFLIGCYPVTFDLYDQFTATLGLPRADDNGWGRGNRPVINVSWEDAVKYSQWLSETTGKPYRLPTEAEWEYAARANTTTEYYWGSGPAEEYAWFIDNADGQTQPVGQKKPNAFGLYDMSGNVWEWVQDDWHDNFAGAPENGSAWKTKGSKYRVRRGGSWYYLEDTQRSAIRYRSLPDSRSYYIGFRLAQD